jgi:hypothetical protein
MALGFLRKQTGTYKYPAVSQAVEPLESWDWKSTGTDGGLFERASFDLVCGKTLNLNVV